VIYLGIDPGAGGGLAAVVSGSPAISFHKMPRYDRELLSWLAPYAPMNLPPSPFSDVRAVLEKVSGYVGVGQPGSSMFNFGVEYGRCRMALVALGIPFREVRPQEWQKGLGIPSRKKLEGRADWKNRLKQEARRRFPRLCITLYTADALLIACYAKLIHEKEEVSCP
jgi:hypothetical protein